MQRAIILAPGKTVRAEDFSISIEEEIANSATSAMSCRYRRLPSRRLFRAPDPRLQNQAGRKCRARNNGNKTLAARSLSISRAYLHRLIRLAEPGSVPAQEDNSIFDSGFRESATA